jgi:hypothetical protein
MDGSIFALLERFQSALKKQSACPEKGVDQGSVSSVRAIREKRRLGTGKANILDSVFL